jgi:hypothetical protein
MNEAYSFEDPFPDPGSNWTGLPYVYGDAAQKHAPSWQLFNGPYAAGVVSPTAQPEMIHLTGLNSLSALASATSIEWNSTGSNLTWSSPSGTSTVGMAVNDRPTAEPLVVRRFYHWNKSATAGTRATTTGPSTPKKEDAADTHTVPEGIAIVGGAQDAGKTVATVEAIEEEVIHTGGHGHRRGNRHQLMRRTVLSPRSLTGMAVVLVGQKRSMIGVEWQGHLLGEPDRGLTQPEQIRAARGFVLAAVRYRLQDAADQAWRPVDAVLRSRALSNLFMLIPTVMAAMLILHHEGTLGVVASAESIVTIGGTLYALIRVGRWYRDVKPSDPKAKRAKEKQ